jgi:hypothetical protein
MTKKVVIYTRVSTLDQTIDNQLIELRDHCSKMGWEIVKEYADEGLSGALWWVTFTNGMTPRTNRRDTKSTKGQMSWRCLRPSRTRVVQT